MEAGKGAMHQTNARAKIRVESKQMPNHHKHRMGLKRSNSISTITNLQGKRSRDDGLHSDDVDQDRCGT